MEKRIKNSDGMKYLQESQIKALRRMVRDQSLKRTMTSIREWAVIDVLTSSGLRVSEASNIRCGDLHSGYGESEIFVREGKGSKSRSVQIPDPLKIHLKSFLKWKEDHGEEIGQDSPLFSGKRGPWTSQAIQQIVKKYLKRLGFYERGKSAHSLRHSYAIEYYRKSDHDLRGLQKQLGHSSLQSTQIYADVTKEDIRDHVKGLWT